MRKTLSSLLIIFSLSLSFAANADVFGKTLNKISKEELSRTFRLKGLEPVVKDLYAASMSVGKKYIKNKKNKNGQKVTDKRGQAALIRIVEATYYISKSMEPGNVHYYGPAKLYKNFRVDMNLAIERARIPSEDKSLFRSALPNSY